MNDKLPMAEDKKWYDKGLKFKCTGCGKCCTGSPGFVWVSAEEIVSIANFLKLSISNFKKRYLRVVDNRFCLTERKKNYDCIFLDGKKCTIYAHRPTQCKTFPWWIHNISSEAAWQEAGKDCEGINHPDGQIVPFETITAELNKQQEETPL